MVQTTREGRVHCDGLDVGNRTPSGPSEASLVERACQGDEQAFTLLVGWHQRTVYALCLRFVGPADAEDLAQEAFVRAFIHRGRLDPSRPLLPWLLIVARRLCIDHLRCRKSEVQMESATDISDQSDGPEGDAVRNERLVAVKRELSALAPGPREAIVLYAVDGLAYGRIAEVLEVPIGTVMTWLHRGRRTLRERLGWGESEKE